MNNPESSFDSFRTIPQTTSPHSKRNTKNLSLQLNRSNTVSAQQLDFTTAHQDSKKVRSQAMSSVVSNPMIFTASSPQTNHHLMTNSLPSSPSTTATPVPITQTRQQLNNTHQLYRHPSISRGTENDHHSGLSYSSSMSPSSSLSSTASTTLSQQPVATISRRSTLSLAIPTDMEISKSSSSGSSGKLSSTNSIPSFSSSSPISSSPLIPATPNEPSTPLLFSSSLSSSSSDKRSSSHSSTSTLKTLPRIRNGSATNTITTTNNNDNTGGEVLKTQTLIRDLSSFQISDEGDQSKLNCYPNGPACVLPPNLFLYSEPKLQQIEMYDLVINVAKELSPPLPHVEQPSSSTSSISHYSYKGTEYYYVPWTHTSVLCPDLPFLTDVILEYLALDKRVLIHCQCGVSRSASLIVALFMKMNHVGLNEAYNELKLRAPDISPNMSLIFQLMEWGELIGVNSKNSNEYGEEE